MRYLFYFLSLFLAFKQIKSILLIIDNNLLNVLYIIIYLLFIVLYLLLL